MSWKRGSFADGSVGAKVRLVVRGCCLPVRGSRIMTWKDQYDMCVWTTGNKGTCII